MVPLVKIVGVISYFLLSLGNCLIVGIIHYEKFGQDSQKRSFTDRIFTFNAWLFICLSFINDTLLEVRSLFGPLGNFPTLLIYYLRSTMMAIPLGQWFIAILGEQNTMF